MYRNIVDKSDKDTSQPPLPEDIDKIMLKGSSSNIDPAKKKDYVSTDTYKPLGIYNENLLNKINAKMNSK